MEFEYDAKSRDVRSALSVKKLKQKKINCNLYAAVNKKPPKILH